MEAKLRSTTTSSSLHRRSPFPTRLQRRPVGLHLSTRRQTVPSASKKGDNYGWDYGGGLVDANMIVLRKRIHELELVERNYEPPSHWMEWEKRYYTSYGSDICEVVGLLQTLLMSTRPSVAIGSIGFLAFSVPTSVLLILFHLI